MALPTKGRVIIDTTVGEIDIELWSKARPSLSLLLLPLRLQLRAHAISSHSPGNAQGMSELYRAGYGGFVSFLGPMRAPSPEVSGKQDTTTASYFTGRFGPDPSHVCGFNTLFALLALSLDS